MTETTTSTTDESAAPRGRGRGPGLEGKVLAELQQIASGHGIKGVGRMRKSALIDAIRAAQSTGSDAASAPDPAPAQEAPPARSRSRRPAATDQPEIPQPEPGQPENRGLEAGRPEDTRARPARTEEPSGGEQSRGPRAGQDDAPTAQRSGQDRHERQGQPDKQGQGKQSDQPKQGQNPQNDQPKQGKQGGQGKQGQNPQNDQPKQGKQGGQGKQGQGKQGDQPKQGQGKQADQQGGQRDQSGQRDDRDDRDDDGDDGSRRSRRSRNRNRNRDRRGDAEPAILDDDVLIPAAGILDVLDNYAFVRTSGYLPGENDVYVSLAMVRKHGLRKGDAVVGMVRQQREGERKEKFNPLAQIDSINGTGVDEARRRPEFDALVPLHPAERLRLETGADDVVGRIIDLAAPIGKGQRGLVVSPPKAGRTRILQSVARSIAVNNPECHLMVVLVDERPEEVTDFQRSVKGEVIASTFDRPALDHTTVAELAIERAKRLVELGNDVVVLLDGLSRLGRAYNLASPGSGRTLAGGVDPAALYPPKRFFGAARNIEDGGSLTILATAVVESGSPVDEIVLDELEGAANMELRLRGELAERRHYPAVDVARSGTRREDELMSDEELRIVRGLRATVTELDPERALESVLERIAATQSNVELLTRARGAASGG